MRGFTLIELLVVIAILLLLTAAIPVALDRTLPGRRVAVMAQKLASAIRDTASESQAHGIPETLRFGTAGLEKDGRVAIGFTGATRIRLLGRDGNEMRDLVVYPDGSASSARIEVREASHSQVVVVSGITGRVSIEAHR